MRTLYASGTHLTAFPAGGLLFSAPLNDLSQSDKAQQSTPAILGLYQVGNDSAISGRIAVYGDSNCLDENHRKVAACTWLFERLLDFTNDNRLDESFFPASLRLADAYIEDKQQRPVRMESSELYQYSNVLRSSPRCTLSLRPNVLQSVARAFQPLQAFGPTVRAADMTPVRPTLIPMLIVLVGYYQNFQRCFPLVNGCQMLLLM